MNSQKHREIFWIISIFIIFAGIFFLANPSILASGTVEGWCDPGCGGCFVVSDPANAICEGVGCETCWCRISADGSLYYIYDDCPNNPE